MADPQKPVRPVPPKRNLSNKVEGGGVAPKPLSAGSIAETTKGPSRLKPLPAELLKDLDSTIEKRVSLIAKGPVLPKERSEVNRQLSEPQSKDQQVKNPLIPFPPIPGSRQHRRTVSVGMKNIIFFKFYFFFKIPPIK